MLQLLQIANMHTYCISYKCSSKRALECVSPDGLEGALDFGLHGRQHVSAHLLQQPRHAGVEPVVQLQLVHAQQVLQRLQEDTEHLTTAQQSN